MQPTKIIQKELKVQSETNVLKAKHPNIDGYFRFIMCLCRIYPVVNDYCICNLFAFHKSSLRYNPVDIDIVSCILSSIIYTVLGES